MYIMDTKKPKPLTAGMAGDKMRIDTDIELWEGNAGPQKYRVVITLEATKDSGTDKSRKINNENTKRLLLEKFIKNEHTKINEQLAEVLTKKE